MGAIFFFVDEITLSRTFPVRAHLEFLCRTTHIRPYLSSQPLSDQTDHGRRVVLTLLTSTQPSSLQQHNALTFDMYDTPISIYTISVTPKSKYDDDDSSTSNELRRQS